EVECAATTEDAMERIRAASEDGTAHDLILIDQGAAGGEDDEGSLRVAEAGTAAGSRIIILTTPRSGGRRAAAESTTTVLIKPVRLGPLRGAIERALREGPAVVNLPEPPPSPVAALHGRVLIVEDNPTNQLLA